MSEPDNFYNAEHYLVLIMSIRDPDFLEIFGQAMYDE
jgi:hypothetical protein